MEIVRITPKLEEFQNIIYQMDSVKKLIKMAKMMKLINLVTSLLILLVKVGEHLVGTRFLAKL